jgi:glycerol kinase
MKINIDDNVLQKDIQGGSPVVVGAIDQGTSSTRFLVFSKDGRIVASAQVEITQIFPEGKSGWHEHNPLEIWESTTACMAAVFKALEEKGLKLCSEKDQKAKKGNCVLAAIGITNQRETTIAWNKITGKPYHNAIVWDDLRTTQFAHELADGNINLLRAKTGLPLASYFAGTKVRWLLDNVSQLQEDLKDPQKQSQVAFGTVDSWLIYQLTGQPSSTAGAANAGGIFATDVTNASRWLFMDLMTQKWDQSLVETICAPHHLPIETALPQICPSSHVFGVCHNECGVDALHQVPVAAVLGDQQAALFGQTAFLPGEAKNTYGTGLFLMMNTGTEPIVSTHGLLTTVAYQIGQDAPVHFALEGSVSHSGSTIQWLRDQLNLISSASESETLARTTKDNEGLYFVPAFSGLFAPHWRSDARACIVGMTASHHKGHICRAALEAAAYQTKEVFDAIAADSKVTLKNLKVDGGGTNNKLLMQFQADIIKVPVIKPQVMETTAIGAAFAAGLAVGVWQNLDELKKLWAVAETYQPTMVDAQRNKYWSEWKKAISKSLDWIDEGDDGEDDDEFVDALSDPVQAQKPTAATMTSPVAMILLAGAALCVGLLLGRSHRR